MDHRDAIVANAELLAEVLAQCFGHQHEPIGAAGGDGRQHASAHLAPCPTRRIDQDVPGGDDRDAGQQAGDEAERSAIRIFDMNAVVALAPQQAEEAQPAARVIEPPNLEVVADGNASELFSERAVSFGGQRAKARLDAEWPQRPHQRQRVAFGAAHEQIRRV